MKKQDFLLQNEQASGKYCQAQLEQLSKPLMDDISRGTFSVPGGHNLYLEAVEKLEQSYNLVPRKGVKVRNEKHMAPFVERKQSVASFTFLSFISIIS